MELIYKWSGPNAKAESIQQVRAERNKDRTMNF